MMVLGAFGRETDRTRHHASGSQPQGESFCVKNHNIVIGYIPSSWVLGLSGFYADEPAFA